jgi:hypothetical protein
MFQSNQRNFMRQLVSGTLTQAFGKPVRKTRYVLAWDVGSDFGVVIERESPVSEAITYIWLPYRPGWGSVPAFAQEYPAGKGRSSNTYPSRGLSNGLPALKCRVASQAQLDEVMAWIQARRGSLSFA